MSKKGWERTQARRRAPYRPKRGRVPPWPARDPLTCVLRCHVGDPKQRCNLTPLLVAIRQRRIQAAAELGDDHYPPVPLPCRDEFHAPRYEQVQPHEVHVAVRLDIQSVAGDPACPHAHSSVALHPTTREGLYVYPVRDLLPWQVRALDAFHRFRGRRACACANDDEAFTQRALERFVAACVRVPYTVEDVPNRVLTVHATLAAPIHLRVRADSPIFSSP